MFLLYDAVFLLYGLFYLPYLLLTKRGYTDFRMRFGFFSPSIERQIKARANIWIHAVSVGEVMVVDGFIDLLRKKYPACQVIVTVTTKTGYNFARERLKERAVVLPSPLDFSFITRHFVSLIAPQMYIAVETEIWPNLYRQLHLKQIPLGIINGRISDPSFGRYKAIRFLFKRVLQQVSLWCMQSQRDADRIIELGAPSSRVVVTGNLKFDADSLSSDPSLVNLINNKDEYWWVAGSTHPGEEDIVLDVYGKMVKDNPKWRLVIAPRHIERAPQIIELIARRGLKAVPFSSVDSFENNGILSETIIVVDTIGQLRSLYSIASLVFVGKSLCVGGGQNIIEPAFYGKAVVIGPKFENFRDIVSCFKEKDAMVQVEDVLGFERAVRDLCSDPSKRKALGAAAKAVIVAHQGAAQRSLEHLAEFLK